MIACIQKEDISLVRKRLVVARVTVSYDPLDLVYQLIVARLVYYVHYLSYPPLLQLHRLLICALLLLDISRLFPKIMPPSLQIVLKVTITSGHFLVLKPQHFDLLVEAILLAKENLILLAY